MTKELTASQRRVRAAMASIRETIRNTVYDCMGEMKAATSIEDAHGFEEELAVMVKQFGEQWCAENPF